MLLAHGTTDKMAEMIFFEKKFKKGTFFLKLDQNFEHGMFAATGFALRESPLSWAYVDAYCREDMLIRPFRDGLVQSAKRYIEKKEGDDSLGIVVVADIDPKYLTYHKGFFRNLMFSTEVYANQEISTNAVKCLYTLRSKIPYCASKYELTVKDLESIKGNSLFKRLVRCAQMRFSRVVLRRA